jgi:hypothetical protein
MAKVTRPLFSDSANGRIADIGSFRMSSHGPQFIRQAEQPRKPNPEQAKLNACFAEAKRAHSAIPPQKHKVGNIWYEYRTPDWPTFWRNWLATHPECT